MGLFLRQLQNWFTDNMPTVKTKFIEMNNLYTKDDPQTWEKIKADGDAAIIGVVICVSKRLLRRRSPRMQ